jgi:hypothetical protein
MKKSIFFSSLVLGLMVCGPVPVSQAQELWDVLRAIKPNTNPPVAQPPALPPTPPAPAPAAAVLDTRPAFMAIVTNTTLKTNLVIVTNYVVVTNVGFATNFYNAQGQLLQPAGPPPIPGLIPIAPTVTTPDPAAVKAAQTQAIKDLLASGVTVASNKLCAAGSFTKDAAITIQVPDGVTVFDRKKGQALQDALNLAAEKAAPEALATVFKAVGRLQPDNPAQVLRGDKDEATRLLATAQGQAIADEILPAVQRASTAARVSEAYQNVMVRGGGLFGALLGTSKPVDLDAHLTRGVMEAVFKSLTAQESIIRTDPQARKTKALQDAFAK